MSKTTRLTIVLVLLSTIVAIARAGSPPTPGEARLFTRYTQNEDISHFLSLLDSLSPELQVQVIGRSFSTGTSGSKDLYLCVVTAEGIESAAELNRRKPTILLFASQHGDEQSAKEAALQVIRDLTVGDLKPLLQKVNFLVIPQVNPHGTWTDQRRNEQDLDLNRDHVKLEAPETEAIHQVFRTWMPEVTLDAHEKGDDFYRASFGSVSNLNADPQLQVLSRGTILRQVASNLEEAGIPFHEYLVTQPMGIDSSAGVAYRPEDVDESATLKRYSTTDVNDGRNSLGIYETLSFILECSSRGDLPTLGERTRWQYSAMRFFSEAVAEHAQEIIDLVPRLRRDLIARARVYSDDDRVHLRMEYVRKEEEPTLTIQQYADADSAIRGILKTDKKAGEVLTSEDVEPYPHPSRYAVEELVVENWFPIVRSNLSVSRPLGYIVPAKRQGVVEALLRHGLELHQFTKEFRLAVEAYETREVVAADYDYLAPEKIDVERTVSEILIQKGDYFVSCAQAGANVLPIFLEPQSQYGFIRYRMFDLIPEEGEVYAIYRVVGTAELPVVPYKSWHHSR